MLELRDISFSYGKHQVIRNLNLEVSIGDILGVVGVNGAGKSTLLRLMASVMPPHEGQIQLNGLDAFLNRDRYRRCIAYIPECAPLYPEMTPRGFIYYRARLKRERWLRVKRCVNQALERFDLTSVADTPIEQLSSGCQKRVALADLFLLSPSVLILDDPFARLDGMAQKYLADAINDAALRSAVILSGHELDQMASYCTRFIILADGNLTKEISVRNCPRQEIPELLRSAMANGGKVSP